MENIINSLRTAAASLSAEGAHYGKHVREIEQIAASLGNSISIYSGASPELDEDDEGGETPEGDETPPEGDESPDGGENAGVGE